MISGEPPFHGENHIDLLRNIQRKAVRLPKDVRVSKECVNLLRLLLSRNPLTRAGFKEFFEACDSLVALGCNGVATVDEGSCRRPSLDLGTIPEYPLPTPSITDSVMTVVTNSAVQLSPSGPSTTLTVVPARDTFTKQPGSPYTTFSPLVPSPPTSSGVSMTNHAMTELAIIGNSKRMPQAIEMPTRRHETEVNSGGLHNSSDESSFVMVEHGTSSQHHVSNAVTEPPVSTAVVSHYNESYRRQTQQHDSNRLEQSPPSSPKFFFNKVPVLSSRGDYMVVKSPKGMLSTSPGTGGALMSMLTRRPQLTAVAAGSSPTNRDDGSNKLEMRINAAAKMLAAAEDVGRRAICVAHLGDRRAYAAMRLFSVNESSSSSVASVTPMDGIMEESAEHDSGEVTDDSSSTEIMASARRRRSSVSVADKSMADMKLDDEGEDEMPFAVQSESTPVLTAEFSTRSNSSSIIAIKDSNAMGSHRIEKPVPNMIQSHFSEALSCYLKALKMLQGAIGATESVMREWNSLSSENGTTEQGMYSAHLKQRSEVILNWLGNQFKGVLERGNAANTEIAKLPSSQNSANQSSLSSVEELLYHHSLGYGREGAVKQLLGHYEAARFCYRSAGLLAETLLMEPKIENDDRKTLESFVDGFAMQITEIDELIMQQSQHRLTASNIASSHASVRRGPSVVGLVGNPFATCSGAK